MPSGNHPTVALVVDGRPVEVPDDGASLLDALRDHAGVTSVKDGCSPQGQCGCCTVLVDGQARVACVTPVRRVAGRAVTTVAGLPDAQRWADALCATGGTQCGFCTPGIVVRLAGTAVAQADRALLAHLCRCTGWQPILEAARRVEADDAIDPWAGRDPDAAARRAAIEGGTPQRQGPDVALGGGGFAADTAPAGALVAVPAAEGEWVVAGTLAEARIAAGKVQGRRTTESATPPIAAPPGDWALTLRTSWCEPGYLETDASWCEPGGEPTSPLANGGAFGGKATSPLPAVARRLADEHARPVLALWSREDATRLGPKRPPVAAAVDADGTGVIRVARTAGIADAIRSYPGLDLTVEEVDVPGPPTSADLRAAGWAEVALLRRDTTVVDPHTGARATATLDADGLHVTVEAGDPLDEVVLRSYCTGAAHQALGWIASEGIAVAGDGEVLDLTIRSFGILRAVDLPPIQVTVEPGDGEPKRASDAVFAAVAVAAWVAQGCPPDLPTRRPYR